MITSELIRQRVNGLPSLPTSVMSLAKVAGDDRSTIDDIYRVLEKDPALSSSILKLANSAIYATSTPAEDLRTAIHRLGMDAIMSLGRGVAVIRNYRESETLDMVRLWQHSTAVGLTAKAICKHLNNAQMAEVAFLAGLLHDIGKIALDRCFTKEYAPVASAIKAGKNDLDAEMEILGTTHAEVGEEVAINWKFPETIQEAIRDHHHPKDGSFLSMLIHYSDLLVRTRFPNYPADENIVLNLGSDERFKNMVFGIQGEIIDIEYLTFRIDDEVDHAIAFVQLAYQD
jgi:putative nucleotidyltransferase with HDIG domain